MYHLPGKSSLAASEKASLEAFGAIAGLSSPRDAYIRLSHEYFEVARCGHRLLPMKHDPLGDGDNALLRLIESRQFCLDSIIGISHRVSNK